jgi:CysZ protein
MMAIQYIDYPMDNNGLTFKRMKVLLKERRWSALSLGSVIQLGMLVPLLNLILMPAAVIGATIFWLEEYEAQDEQCRIE